MSFSSDLGRLIAEQLSRFVTLNRHQLAGQVANLDFWFAEVRHALDVIDGYGRRFEKMRAAQQQHVADHATTQFELGGDLLSASPAPGPRRVPDTELKESRKTLCDAAYRFGVRCCQEGFITESRLREACDELGISVASTDLKRLA